MDLDPAPDPAIFIIGLQDANFSAYYFLKVHLHQFSKIKSHKEVTKSKNRGFSYYFCFMVEGSGFVPQTNGSGSRSLKNTGPDPQLWYTVALVLISNPIPLSACEHYTDFF
jgi:hypothetical protein